MAGRPYTLLDVFTDTPLEGNALAVVHDADDLDDETMHRFARETRLSETTFVQAATEPGADYRNRIWMMDGEVPFAGHPSLGTAVAIARARGEQDVRYVQQTGAGLQPVDVQLSGERAFASMLQEPAVFGATLDAEEMLAAVRLDPRAAQSELPALVVGTGVPQLLVPVRERESLARASPDHAAIGPLLLRHGAIVLYLFHATPGEEDVRARSFTGSAEAGEDPGTGSAAGPLCAYLARHGGVERIQILQGVEMGRPSRLLAELHGQRVRVGGDVVCVVDGRLAI